MIAPVTFEVTTDRSEMVPKFDLTCISTGGPVDSGQWTIRNGEIVSRLSPMLTNRVSATYESVLSSALNGTYSCTFFLRDGVNLTLRNITSSFTVLGRMYYIIYACTIIHMHACTIHMHAL